MNQILLLAPVGYRFTHIIGAEDLRLHGTYWVKVANQYDAYGRTTGNIIAVEMTTESCHVLSDEVLDGRWIGVTYNGRT